MPIATAADFLNALRERQLLESAQLDELDRRQHEGGSRPLPTDPRVLARELIERGWLTAYQVNQLLYSDGQHLLLGFYVLLDRLGEGGMGAVYKAYHRHMKRTVAVKVIRKDRLTNPQIVRRFTREIRAAAQLNHPNIVHAYDADEIGGTHILAMEYVEGTDLARLVKTSGPLAVGKACDYIRQAALGLQHAYRRGLIHRDIKPDNLLLVTGESLVKISDFGLARLDLPMDDGASSEHLVTDGSSSLILTKAGAIMGTPDYMAPEQAENPHAVDIRADLYSLGCSFFFLLTGQVPFPGGSLLQKLSKHQSTDPPAVEELRSEVPLEVGMIVRKLMAKRPEERYQTPAELVSALNNPWVVIPAKRSSQDRATVPVVGKLKSANEQAEPHPVRRRTIPRAVKLISLALWVPLGALLIWWTGAGSALVERWKSIPSAADQPSSSRKLTVSSVAGKGQFRSIGGALAKAIPGDRIVVLDDVLEEKLELQNLSKVVKDVTIEPDSSVGKRVVWRPPPPVKEEQPQQSSQLLSLTSCEGLTIKGFHIIGQNGSHQVQDLVVIFGKCPGLTLENMSFEGFRRSAVKLINCTGESSRPITLTNVYTIGATDPANASALIFEMGSNSVLTSMQHVKVTDCLFEGPCRSAIQLAIGDSCGLAFTEIARNRFYRITDGIWYKRPARKPFPPLSFTLESNTFLGLERGLLLETMPLDERSKVVISNNLFVQTKLLAQAGDLNQGIVGRTFTIDSNVRDAAANEGNLALKAVVADSATVISDRAADKTLLLRYPVASPLNQAGKDKGPVGVPPLQ